MSDDEWLPYIDESLCTGCGDCIAICPTQALALVEGTAVLVSPAACDYSAICEAICPVEAIAIPYQVSVAFS